MKAFSSSRTRAGMLLVALALVGGTGCITTAIVHDVQQKNRMREAEEARQKRMALLLPLADAGDAAAATALVREMLAVPASTPVDQARVFALLSRAADQAYGPAQALLGEIMVTGTIQTAYYGRLTAGPGFRDRERGLQLLRQAAAQACVFRQERGSYSPGSIQPAITLSRELERVGRADEGRLWRARSVLHCGQPGAESLSWQTVGNRTTPAQRTQALVLMLLTGDAARIATAEAAMPAEEVAAARREAEQLRRQVAQSEQQYPAPGRKEM